MQKEPIADMLSAYLDGELTQAEMQRVRLTLEDSEELREHYRQLQELKSATSEMAFVAPPEERMEELERRLSVQAPRRLGWLLFLIGTLAVLGFALWELARAPDMPLLAKGAAGSLIGGLALLLGSVARQRLLELPHDRYRGVKR